MIRESTEVTYNTLTQMLWSDMRAFLHITRRGRVLSHLEKMRTSNCTPDEYISVGGDASHTCGSIS